MALHTVPESTCPQGLKKSGYTPLNLNLTPSSLITSLSKFLIKQTNPPNKHSVPLSNSSFLSHHSFPSNLPSLTPVLIRDSPMSDHPEEQHESLMEKIADKIHGHHSSSSSSSDDDEKMSSASPAADHVPPPEVVPEPDMSAAAPAFPSDSHKIFRLFGRQKPVHKVLGGGKSADVLLWRNKKISATALGVATVIWFLFELLEYHLLTLICHIMIVSLVVLFLWSKASTFLNKSSPHIPDVHIPDNALLEFISVLRFEINQALHVLRDIASGKDLKKFLAVVAGLWIVSVVGSWFNFLTLVYLLFVLLHTVPVLYEKYEDHVDTLAEKATKELKRHYAVADEKFLSKIPRGLLKDKKAA